jgi:hypothetical protein
MASPGLERKPAPAPAPAQAKPPAAVPALASGASGGGLAAAVKRQADAAGPRVSLGLAGPSAEEVSLKGTGTFAPPQPVADFLAANPHGGEVSVRLPGVAAGVIRVHRRGDKYSTPSEVQAIDLVHPALEPLRRAGLTPLLVVEISASTVTGYVTVSTGKRPLESRHAVIDQLRRNAPAMGFAGMGNLRLHKPVNQLQGGTLTLSTDLAFQLGGFLNGTGSFGLADDAITFAAQAHASVKGIAEVSLDLKRGADGVIAGRAEIPVSLKNFSGSVIVTLAGDVVDAVGTIRYSTEKLNGEVTLLVTDAQTARTVAYDHLPPEAIDASAREAAGGGGGAAAAKTPKPGPRALAGWGTLDARFSDWLTGRAVVIVDGEGHVTVIGKITPQARVEFAQTRVASRTRLLTLEARATYGIPVVGDVFVFFSLSLDSVVNVTPLTLSKIEVDGTYSTDPKIFNSFSLSANLNISAMAALELDARAGAGLEIAEHDIKIGAGVTATAGVKSYLDATPILGYRELADPTAGRRGEFYIHGDVELAAQAFLALAGYLFVALETPWWSPISDHTWKWPIGELEYILPGQFGFGAEIDYIFGSGKLPSISLKGVDFNPDRFSGDLMDDNVPKGAPGPQEKRGAWKEKLTAPPAPPPAPPKVLDSKGKRAPKDNKAVKTEGAAFADGVKAIDALRKRADATPMPAAELAAELEAIRKRCGLTDLHTKPGTGLLEVTASRGKLKLPKPVRIKVATTAVSQPPDRAAAMRAGSGIAPDQRAPGAAHPPGHDPRHEARAALASQLRADHTIEEARSIVAAIGQQLKPIGLRKLEVAPENSEGSYTILAEASPVLPLAYLVKKVKAPRGRSVRVAAEITLAPPSPDSLSLAPGGSKFGGGPILPASDRAIMPYGGAALKTDPARPNVVQAVTWNTSDIDTVNNDSHAEHHLIAFIVNRLGDDGMGRILRIKVNNFHLSPCSTCAGELATLLEEIAKQRQRPFRPDTGEAELRWTKLYLGIPKTAGINRTTWQSVNKLTGAGWRLYAPRDALPDEGADKDEGERNVHLI